MIGGQDGVLEVVVERCVQDELPHSSAQLVQLLPIGGGPQRGGVQCAQFGSVRTAFDHRAVALAQQDESRRDGQFRRDQLAQIRALAARSIGIVEPQFVQSCHVVAHHGSDPLGVKHWCAIRFADKGRSGDGRRSLMAGTSASSRDQRGRCCSEWSLEA